MTASMQEEEQYGPYRGRVAGRFRGAALADALAAAARPAEPVASRNSMFRIEIPLEGGSVGIHVKAFGPQSLLKDLRDSRRGSKARRTYLAARALAAAGVGTPEPAAYLERWEGRRLRESYYLSVFVPGLASFRDELIRLFREDPDCGRFMTVLQTVADAVRALHAAGFCHNDLGNQNILLRRTDTGWADVRFVDLNRGRLYAALDARRRGRDVSRIALPSDLLRVFREMLYAPDVPPRAFLRWDALHRRLFAWHTATRAWRHPVRMRRLRRAGDPTPRYPEPREMWIWDPRSGQPINALRGRDRARVMPAGRGLRLAADALRAAPRVRRAYRAARDGAFRAQIAMQKRAGVAVEPCAETEAEQRTLLDALGHVPLLVRFYHHAGPEQWAFAARFLRERRAAGHPVAAALVQDRRAVRDGNAWQRFVRAVLDDVHDIVDWVELGHAINRVKWGIWDRAEYRRLVAGGFEAAEAFPDARLVGPAAIDFEYPYVLGALEAVPRGRRFAALSHHLYVDRRGAPENRQGRFATLEKCALARAIAAASDACEDRLIISEVNWPLLGTGVYSPVGSPYVSFGPRRNDPSVNEDVCADYLVRYLLIALCSGLAERVYWWRLAAHGYGLADDRAAGGWRRRPAFDALRTWHATVGRARFLGCMDGLGAEAGQGKSAERAYMFERVDGARFAVAYTTGPARTIAPPWPVDRILDSRGRDMALEASGVRLSGSPLILFSK
jgi:hypothetical protein